MKESKILGAQIRFGLHNADTLFSGDWGGEGLNLKASTDQFNQMLIDSIRATFPGFYIGTQGMNRGSARFVGESTFIPDRGDEKLAELQEKLFESDAWMVIETRDEVLGDHIAALEQLVAEQKEALAKTEARLAELRAEAAANAAVQIG